MKIGDIHEGDTLMWAPSRKWQTEGGKPVVVVDARAHNASGVLERGGRYVRVVHQGRPTVEHERLTVSIFTLRGPWADAMATVMIERERRNRGANDYGRRMAELIDRGNELVDRMHAAGIERARRRHAGYVEIPLEAAEEMFVVWQTHIARVSTDKDYEDAQ